MMTMTAFEFPLEWLAEFCKRWKISELAVFGSAVRGGFRSGGSDPSDVDLLVTYAPDAAWSLLDESRMVAELESMLGRPVDLVSRRAVEQSHNTARRREILSTTRVLYAA